MVLGLDTAPTVSNLVTGLVVVCSIGLSVETARMVVQAKRLNSAQRYLTYALTSVLLCTIWMIVYAGTYLPGSEVETAVIPGLSHWWQYPWEAPYGAIWYGLNWAILQIGNLYYLPIHALFGAPYPESYLWMMMLSLWNLPFLWLFRKSELLTAYLMTSLFLWFVIPWDLPILWIVSLGFLGHGFLPRIGPVLLAIVAKVPVGAPASVWKYDFLAGNDGTGSAFVPGHWMPYFVLGAWSIAVILKPYIRFLSLDSYFGQEVNRRITPGDSDFTGQVEGSTGTETERGPTQTTPSSNRVWVEETEVC